jgi:hypothetical protein
MPDFIKDGVGQGYLAKVNKKNEVAVRTSSVQQHTRSALDGNYYELTT